jgi:hypothetical protein
MVQIFVSMNPTCVANVEDLFLWGHHYVVDLDDKPFLVASMNNSARL